MDISESFCYHESLNGVSVFYTIAIITFYGAEERYNIIKFNTVRRYCALYSENRVVLQKSISGKPM